MLARHESLRTVYPDSDDGPYQQVVDVAQVPFDLTPVRGAPRPNSPAGLAEFATEGFDVTVAPPLRIRLFAMSEQRVPARPRRAPHLRRRRVDGAARAGRHGRLQRAHRGRGPAVEPLPVQYADFALWQRDVLGDPADTRSLAGKQIAYWADTLPGHPS